MLKYEAVVIGVSCGGLDALKKIFTSLPADFPLPVLVVQHLHPSQSDEFFSGFQGSCPLNIKTADEKEMIVAGTIYFAPPNYHLLVEKDRTLTLSVDERVNFSRPSVDVLFESAADVFGAGLVGVVLTGANADGADGLRIIKERGGLTVVQDPASAVADYMPRAALDAVSADHVLPLTEVGPFLVGLVRN